MSKTSVLLCALLLLLIAFPAQGKITFGVVAGGDGPISSEDQARQFATYLAKQLIEDVSVQVFKNEKTLHAWLNRYHLVDLALLGDDYLARQPPGEFFRLADYVTRQSPGTLSPELFVARQGINPWVLKKLQRALLTMGENKLGRSTLAKLDMLAVVPVNTRPEKLASLPPQPSVAEEPRQPAPTPPVQGPTPSVVAPQPEIVTAEPRETEAPVVGVPQQPAPASVTPPKAEPPVVVAAPLAELPQPKPVPAEPPKPVAPVVSAPAPPPTAPQPESVAVKPEPPKAEAAKPEPPVAATVAPPESPRPEPVAVEPPAPKASAKLAATAEKTPVSGSGEALLEVPRSAEKLDRVSSGDQPSFRVEQVDTGVFAALAQPGGHATSNAFFMVGPEYVIAGGAHMAKQTIDDLVTAIGAVTDKPLRYFILAHHHVGYNYIDFDFPAGVDLIISWQTWKAMDDEIREMNRPILFFSDGLTLKLGERTIVLTNMGPAHTEGDTLVFMPEPGVLFTSDLVYVKSVGYMGDGHMEDWLLALEFIERLEAKKIIPGAGPVGGTEDITRFKDFFRDLVSAVLKHVEQGDSLEQTLKTFTLAGYGQLNGYDRFIRINVQRIYLDLKENFTK